MNPVTLLRYTLILTLQFTFFAINFLVFLDAHLITVFQDWKIFWRAVY